MIEEQAAPIAHLIAIGGEHTITLPLLRALAGKTGPLGLVHFDAHIDTWSTTLGRHTPTVPSFITPSTRAFLTLGA